LITIQHRLVFLKYVCPSRLLQFQSDILRLLPCCQHISGGIFLIFQVEVLDQMTFTSFIVAPDIHRHWLRVSINVRVEEGSNVVLDWRILLSPELCCALPTGDVLQYLLHCFFWYMVEPRENIYAHFTQWTPKWVSEKTHKDKHQ
jgi:hypothetical protein